jgi:hypothetical protein
MDRQALSDGSGWFDKDTASYWHEETLWDGRNNISAATGSQWHHQALWRTASGDWILSSWSAREGSGPTRWRRISAARAATWLVENGHGDDAPADTLAASQL